MGLVIICQNNFFPIVKELPKVSYGHHKKCPSEESLKEESHKLKNRAYNGTDIPPQV